MYIRQNDKISRNFNLSDNPPQLVVTEPKSSSKIHYVLSVMLVIAVGYSVYHFTKPRSQPVDIVLPTTSVKKNKKN